MQGLPRENDGFWGEVPRDFVETELKLSLSMGEENKKFQQQNEGFWEGAPRDFAEYEL